MRFSLLFTSLSVVNGVNQTNQIVKGICLWKTDSIVPTQNIEKYSRGNWMRVCIYRENEASAASNAVMHSKKSCMSSGRIAEPNYNKGCSDAS